MNQSQGVGSMGLSDAQLLAVSKRVTNPGKLRELTCTGLKVPEYEIDAALTNHPGDIQGAAHAVLRLWFQRQTDQQEALRNLVTALQKSDMNNMACELEQPARNQHAGITNERFKDIQRWLKGSIKMPQFSSVPEKDWTRESGRAKLKQVYTKPTLTRINRDHHQPQRQPLEDIPTLLGEIQDTNPQHPVRILVQAGGGMGKSTLLRQLALTWTLGTSEKLNKFQMVFHLALKHVKDDSAIEDLIIVQHKGLKANKVQPAEIRSILDGDYRVLLLLDGHDEYKEGRNKDIDEAISAESLWNSWIITTSRDSKLKNYMEAEVEILGFQGNEVETFIEKYLGSPQRAALLLREAALRGLCLRTEQGSFVLDGSLLTVPYLLNMVCFLFNQNKTLPRTRTGIIDAMVSRMVDREAIKTTGQKTARDSRHLIELGKLAWQALEEEANCFEKNSIPPEILELGILEGADNFVQQEEEEDGVVWFPHLMLLHFAAGVYISDLNQTQLEGIFPTIESLIQYFDVILFAFGLCDQPSPLSQVLFERLSEYLSDKWEESYEILQILQDERTEGSTLDMFHNNKLNYTTRESPKLCIPSQFYRFDDNTPDVSYVEYQITQSDLGKGDPAECAIQITNKKSLLNVLNILVKVQKHEKVCLTHCHYMPAMPATLDEGNIDEGIVLTWARALQHCQRLSHFSMKGLDLSKAVHKTVVEQLNHCKKLSYLFLMEMQLHRSLAAAVSQMKLLKWICLDTCQLSVADSQSLMVALRDCADLGSVRLSNIVLSKCIELLLGGVTHQGYPQLSAVYLQRVNLMKDDLSSLAVAAANGKMPKLKVLCLSGNILTDCLHALLPDDPHPGYPELEALQLNSTSPSKLDMEHLTDAAEKGKLPKLQNLSLQGNNLTGYFIQCQDEQKPVPSTMMDLDMSHCNLTKSDLKGISRVFASTRVLRFNCTKLNQAIGGLFMNQGALRVEILELQNTNLSDDDLVSLTQAMKSGKLPHLDFINISYNNFRGLEHLILDLIKAGVQAKQNARFTVTMCRNDVSNIAAFKTRADQIGAKRKRQDSSYALLLLR